MDSYEAMATCANALDGLRGDDLARPEVIAIYKVAGSLRAAKESTPHAQVNDYIPVPDWLGKYKIEEKTS